MSDFTTPTRFAAKHIVAAVNTGLEIDDPLTFEGMVAVAKIEQIIADAYRPTLESVLKALDDLIDKEARRGGILIPCPIEIAARKASEELKAIIP